MTVNNKKNVRNNQQYHVQTALEMRYNINTEEVILEEECET